MNPIDKSLSVLANVPAHDRISHFPALHRFIRPTFFEYVIEIPASNTFEHVAGLILPSGNDWLFEHCLGGFDAALDQRCNLILSFELEDDRDAFERDWQPRTIENRVEQVEVPGPDFGGTMARLAIYSRNAVSWLSARSWTHATKKADIEALKAAKAALAPDVVEQAANDLAPLLRRLVGSGDALVTHVACGHSKRPDCFACQLAQRVAEKLGLPFRKLFGDRFVAGVSHPKEFRKLPPIELEGEVDAPMVLVIDDVATSGWHMEEALDALRAQGVGAMGAVWISGSVE